MPDAALRLLDHVPVIDIGPFIEGSAEARQDVPRRWARTCEQLGFLVVKGHGVPEDLLARAFATSAQFYEQSTAQKECWRAAVPGLQRGYQAFASRALARTIGEMTPPDLRESFQLGPLEGHQEHFRHLPQAASSYASNVMPTTPPYFAETLVALYREFERLSGDLLRIFALGLGLHEDYFEIHIKRHFSVMSSHHYPALRVPPEPGQLRTGAHTDFGAFTILAPTQAAGGLEVLLPDGRWCAVNPSPGELVINLGDMMARWTNGRWQSTLHRVANPPADSGAPARRQSIGYFMHPDFDAEIACLPTCLRPGEVPHHPPITAGEHIRQKISASNGMS